jgi:hypothetical protein
MQEILKQPPTKRPLTPKEQENLDKFLEANKGLELALWELILPPFPSTTPIQKVLYRTKPPSKAFRK